MFERDGHRCIICGEPPADAHHIIERRLWPDGGYYIENGASLCARHHVEAEQTLLSCEAIRHAAGISVIALPPHFDREERYDKWGNVFLPSGSRVRGELFDDVSVQRILREGGVLEKFTRYVKFPKIAHLPWSEGIDARTDLVMSENQAKTSFDGQDIVVTEKVDGENTSMYSDYLHARSLGGRPHPSRSWVKNLHSRIAHEIPEGWRICGENVFAEHSIHYKELPSFFLVFAIYNERNACLSWDETTEYAGILGLSVVPVLYRGLYDQAAIRECYSGKSTFQGSAQEGYVVRVASLVPWRLHRHSFAKFVREGHSQTSHGWMHKVVTPNELAK